MLKGDLKIIVLFKKKLSITYLSDCRKALKE